MAALTGKDFGETDLQSALQPYIDQINQHCPISSARIILNELSEAVESQYALAEFLDKAIENNHHYGKSDHLFADHSYPESQWISDKSALIDFIRRPVTDETIREFTAAEKDFPAEKARQFYDELWALPFQQRTDFLSEVFKGPGLFKDVKALLDHGLSDEFLPPDAPEFGDSCAYRIGKKVIYGITMMPPSPGLMMRMFSSLVSSLHDDALEVNAGKRTSDQYTRFGYRLGHFMSNLGPGAVKTAQFGHSLPITPDAWVPGVRTSKNDAARPSRSEYLAYVNASVPEEVRQHIQHIGQYRGTGSYLCNYDVTLTQDYLAANPIYERYIKRYPDKGLVLAVMKPCAKKDAVEFNDYLINLGQTIKTFSPAAADSVAPLIELVKQGKSMVEKETDLNYSALQEGIAGYIYENLKLRSGQKRVSYYTQGAYDYGDAFRISLCVTGKHFNELPESTASEKATKRFVATVLFATEVYNILSGQPFNHDVHGDNQGVDINGDHIEIGNFDSGAMAVEPPTKEQKELFVDCLMNSMANSMRNKYGFLSSLKHTIAKTSQTLGPDKEADLDYINSVMRATISLGDYMHYMKPNDYKHAFLAVLEAGHIDPVITSRLSERVTAMGLDKTSKSAHNIPLLGPMLRGLSQALESASTSAWAAAQIVRDERQQGQHYYPENPNPAYRKWTKEERAEHKAKKTQNREPVDTIKLEIENSNGAENTTFSGRLLAGSAALAKQFVK